MLLEEPTSTNILLGKLLLMTKTITSEVAARTKKCRDDSYLSL